MDSLQRPIFLTYHRRWRLHHCHLIAVCITDVISDYVRQAHTRPPTPSSHALVVSTLCAAVDSMNNLRELKIHLQSMCNISGSHNLQGQTHWPISWPCPHMWFLSGPWSGPQDSHKTQWKLRNAMSSFTSLHLNETWFELLKHQIHTLAMLHCFKQWYPVRWCFDSESNKNALQPIPLVLPPTPHSSCSSTPTDLSSLPTSLFRMSWAPYPTEPGVSSSEWQNQVAHNHYRGPSGVFGLVIYAVTLIILNGFTFSIAFWPSWEHHPHQLSNQYKLYYPNTSL